MESARARSFFQFVPFLSSAVLVPSHNFPFAVVQENWGGDEMKDLLPESVRTCCFVSLGRLSRPSMGNVQVWLILSFTTRDVIYAHKAIF